MIKIQKTDIPYESARQAYYNVSFNPERRADSEQEEYVRIMQTIVEEFEPWATDDNRAEIAADLERFRQGYVTRTLAHLAAMSRCMSSMITGPANFPVRQQEKRRNTEHNRLEELLEYKEKVLSKLEQKYNPTAKLHAPIMSGDADALEKLKKKLEKLEERQEFMKAVNKICRDKKTSKEQKHETLSEKGIDPTSIHTMLNPQYSYERPFQSYQLSNNNAEIHRLKGRIRQLEAVKALGSSEQEIGEVTIRMNTDAHRVQIEFPDKPSADCRKDLKSHGFRWAPSASAWQKHLSERARREAQQIVETHYAD